VLEPHDESALGAEMAHMRWLPVALLAASAAALATAPAAASAQDYPPAYPRPGATLALENERVRVWDIAWLKQEYPVHRHRYDHVGVYYTAGDRIIVSLEGVARPVHTEPWNISFQLRDGTHMEQGASDEPLRAVFVQIKDEIRTDVAAAAAGAAFPADRPTERLANERTNVWEYGPASSVSAAAHGHAHDAVVVSFGADGRPQVRWVARGTTHESDVSAGSTRTFVFEVK
jgi:hypothetical protein